MCFVAGLSLMLSGDYLHFFSALLTASLLAPKPVGWVQGRLAASDRPFCTFFSVLFVAVQLFLVSHRCLRTVHALVSVRGKLNLVVFCN